MTFDNRGLYVYVRDPLHRRMIARIVSSKCGRRIEAPNAIDTLRARGGGKVAERSLAKGRCVIVADKVSKFYGARQALKELSFNIADGEVVGFLGLNGAGKTTVLKILSGLLLPSSGVIRVAGIDSAVAPREVRRRIGFLPDRPPLYDDMTVRDVVAYAGRLNGVDNRDLPERLDEVLQLADLTHVQHDYVEWLSHGYRQRVGIAQAIVHKPDLVILDEPISGLDPEQIVGMRKLIRGLRERHTVLLSSHILGEISHTCDRILVVHDGTIVARGTEEELTDGLKSGRVEIIVRGPLDEVSDAIGEDEEDGIVDPKMRVIDGDGDLVRLDVAVQNDAALERLVQRMVGAGLGVRRVADVEGGLESVFLRLTRGEDTREEA